MRKNGTDGKGLFRRFSSTRVMLAMAAVLVLCLGVIFWTGGDRKAGVKPVVSPPPHAMISPPLRESARQAVTPDPPATETSHRTEIEDESEIAGPPPPSHENQQLAMVLPPAVVGHARPPAWRRFAVPAPAIKGRPMIAVIIDDMGVDRRHSERAIQLPGPLTMSFMSYAEDLGQQTGEARRHGHELMMHMPMQPLAPDIDPGPGALLTSLPPEELRRRVVADLDRFSGYVGINNHMGSRFTADAKGMRVVMEELNRRGLFFVDSLTTDRSVGLETAREAGVPALARNVFLDNVGEVGAVEKQLAKVEDLARRKGVAIAIGHPREATIEALSAWIPSVEKKGLVLVPVSAVMEAKMNGGASRATLVRQPGPASGDR